MKYYIDMFLFFMLGQFLFHQLTTIYELEAGTLGIIYMLIGAGGLIYVIHEGIKYHKK